MSRDTRPTKVPARIEQLVGPLTGLTGAVMTGAGLVLSDIAGIEVVSPYVTAGTIAAAIAEHAGRLQAGSVALMGGLFLLVVFFSHLAPRLDPAGEARWMALTAMVSGLITVTLMALVVAYVRAAVEATSAGADALIVKAIVVFDWDYWRTFAPFICAHLVGAGGAMLRTGTPSRRLGWAALAGAVLPLLLPPGLMTVVFLLWLLVLSVALLVRPTPVERGATETTMP